MDKGLGMASIKREGQAMLNMCSTQCEGVYLMKENERLREALRDCVYVLGQDGAIEGSLRVMEIATAALQQTQPSHAQMSDDKGQR